MLKLLPAAQTRGAALGLVNLPAGDKQEAPGRRMGIAFLAAAVGAASGAAGNEA